MRNASLMAIWALLFGLAACSTDLASQQAKAPHLLAVDSLIQNSIDAENIPGSVIQIKRGDSILHRAAYGFAQKYSYSMQRLTKPEAMTTNYLFDLASLTKVCATTFGIMLLVDKGKVDLDAPIYKYLPEFGEGTKSKITVRHLLTHTSGLPQWLPTYYYASNQEERYHYVRQVPLQWPVGEGRHYSDLGFMLLGDIIERVSGDELNKYVQRELYQPLHLEQTTFNPLDNGYEQIAATSHGNPFEKRMVYDDSFGYNVDADPKSWDGWRNYTLKGEVNDGNAWYANQGIAGHAGLFSTIDDLQVLVDLLINEGTFEGKKIISSATIDTFLTKDRFGNGLGWAMDKDFIAAEGAPEGTFGHTGFTGTSIVVVSKYELSIIFLTNRQNSGPQENGYYFNLDALRQQIVDIALDEVVQ
ncbi:serine hydrolase domain-containing protein [Fodinibius salsisoli]|uniref:Serine hydrolase n=1 Tax=Fodinibius salsisoli TaxID=2820877 RepID=A0ABT3PP04_9BACT|nr:serine hydrolase [Fodinibius salsisoli]MCW9707593.1 serine hydrolase [Fodinibius salsisoli]